MGSSHSTLSCTRGGALADLADRPGQRRDSAGTVSAMGEDKDRKPHACADDGPTVDPTSRPRTSTATHSDSGFDDEKDPTARHSDDASDRPRPPSIAISDTASYWAESERTLTNKRRDSKYSIATTTPAKPFTVSRLVAQLEEEEAEPSDHPKGKDKGKRPSAAHTRYLESGHGRTVDGGARAAGAAGVAGADVAALADLAERQRLMREENYLWLVDCVGAQCVRQCTRLQTSGGGRGSWLGMGTRADEWRDLLDHMASLREDERREKREWKWALDRLRLNLAGTMRDCVLCALPGTFDEDDIVVAVADADETTVASLEHIENGAHFIQHIKDARARVAGRPEAEYTRASLRQWLDVHVPQVNKDQADPTVAVDVAAHLATQPAKKAPQAEWGALMDTIRDSLERRFADCVVCLFASPRSEDVDDMLLAVVSDPTTVNKMERGPSAAHYARHVSDARQRVAQREAGDGDAPPGVERARVVRRQWISARLAHDKNGQKKGERRRTGFSEEAEQLDAAWWDDFMGGPLDAAVVERWLSKQ
ncbi:uncharacterized protein EHS24_008655 [Apiotrichum porosum]|uniref:Uncharacterized protein n=1 Tax=Apiotrichum porosum TaxID=105984 RepID=A0A427XQY4_9TREE|nr:uncharacterized protein EHS24_008655 [Apiotrichum porosum]RSH81218.1 hypothetical protein EHS24_008655 [Apiotrichum porosum]